MPVWAKTSCLCLSCLDCCLAYMCPALQAALSYEVYQHLYGYRSCYCGLACVAVRFSFHSHDIKEDILARLQLIICGLALQVCRKCQLDKPAEEFPHQLRSGDTMDGHCKACHKKAAAAIVAARGHVHQPNVSYKVSISQCAHDSIASTYSATALQMSRCAAHS